MKKIGIDARFYGSTGKGLGRYVQKLIENLEKIDAGSEREYLVFLRKDNFNDYQPKAKNFQKIEADYHWYTLAEQLQYPKFLHQFNLDLMHFGHFNVPIFYKKKFLVTIHDLILFHYPTIKNTTLNRWFYFLKLFAYRLVINSAVRRSVKIIAVSEFTKEDILANFPIKSDKIAVTLEACDGTGQPSMDNQETILKSYGIMKPYLLYVGNAYPHKNLERLVLAYEEVKKQKPKLKLVLVGGEDFFYRRLREFVKKKGIQDVIFTGFVRDEDLAAVYQNSQLYVFPSLYEGFGLPPLEALAQKIPVASSNQTSMPEVLGQAAIYFDPRQVSSIKEAILKGLDDDQLRKKITDQGQERLKNFSWQKMAEETLQCYKECLNRK